MCWSAAASVAMVAAGSAATTVTLMRREPPAIPLTLAYFTLMEALQATGYAVVDECGTPGNVVLTLLSYLHIAVQPLVLNAFAMATAPVPVPARIRRRVWGAAGLATALILFRLVPVEWAGRCQPGDILCGPEICLVSGTWHIGWMLPLNGLYEPLRQALGVTVYFPDYLLAVLVLPLFYGAWRFVLFTAASGLGLAMLLTSDPNELPAVWCLFSIGVLLIGISPLVRRRLLGSRPAAA